MERKSMVVSVIVIWYKKKIDIISTSDTLLFHFNLIWLNKLNENVRKKFLLIQINKQTSYIIPFFFGIIQIDDVFWYGKKKNHWFRWWPSKTRPK